MRALTVRQPWAWAIVHGGKDVENRTRNIAGGYRGPVAIHAGLRTTPDDWQDPTVAAALATVDPLRELERYLAKVQRGKFIGVVDLVDVHPGTGCGCSPWAVQGWLDSSDPIQHLVLANARPLEVPIPARGMLGLWTPDADVLEQLQAVTR